LAAGLAADLGVAAAAFVGTNVDNTVVAMAMVAGAPLERARRIAIGQVFGFVVLVVVAAAGAAVLFEFSTAVVGLLGLVPLAIGLRGLVLLARHRDGDADGDGSADASVATKQRRRRFRPEQRAVGRGFTAAALVTIAAGGDNLAVYIPLFRVGGGTNIGATAAVFVAGEVLVTWLILAGGRHPKARGAMQRVGHVAVPILLCCVGILVLVQADTVSLL
jgi:cadmium resistance protein CadD (predicted permease)